MPVENCTSDKKEETLKSHIVSTDSGPRWFFGNGKRRQTTEQVSWKLNYINRYPKISKFNLPLASLFAQVRESELEKVLELYGSLYGPTNFKAALTKVIPAIGNS